MESQLKQDWNTFRFGFFWFGAAVTASISVFMLVMVLRSSENLIYWYAFNLAIGPMIGYLVAWIGSAYLSVRVVAVFLFLLSLWATLSPGMMLLHSLGLLALMIGTPDRPFHLRKQEPLPQPDR